MLPPLTTASAARAIIIAIFIATADNHTGSGPDLPIQRPTASRMSRLTTAETDNAKAELEEAMVSLAWKVEQVSYQDLVIIL